MIQRTRTTPSPATDNGAKLTGNKAAKAVLDRMLAKAITKVSDLPDRKAKLHYVADMIEAQALVEKNIGFNMGTYRSDLDSDSDEQDMTGKGCGTIACIAGWTMLLEKGADYNTETVIQRGQNQWDVKSSFHVDAANILGITEGESDDLFLGNAAYCSLDDITVEHAVAVIRDFADNGEVRWNHFDSEGKEIT